MSQNDTTKVYIYGLREVGTNDIRYVGHSKNVRLRLWQHKVPSGRMPGNQPFNSWLDEVGENLTYDILATAPVSQARKYEEKYIRIKRGEGHALFNIRQAAQKIYTKEQAHLILSARLGDSIK